MSKICFFSAQYLPHMGGVENYTYNISQELLKKGNEVTVVTSLGKGLDTYEIKNRIKVYRLPSINLMDGRFPILKSGNEKKEIRGQLIKEDFDLVIINTRFYFLSLFAAKFAKENNIPAIFIEHGTSHIQFNNKLVSIVGEIYEHIITFLEKKYTDNFYGVSQACNKWLTHFNIAAKGVIYNSIDTSLLNNHNENINELRKTYSIDKNTIMFCFAGRLIKEKGVIELITAFEKLKRLNYNACLFIAGEGQMDEYVKEHANKNDIYYLGRLQRDKVLDMFIESDVFCLPTDYPEGFPTVVLEAALCKSYIIATDRGGSKELIEDDSYGTILENNSVDLLFNAMKKVLDNQIDIEESINKTYNRAISNYTWEKSAEKVITILKEGGK